MSTQNSQVTSFGLAYQAKYGLNPYQCTDLANRTIFSLLYDGLFTVTSTFAVEPVLCDRYTVSDDLMTYTVTLLENACFTDGTPVSAARRRRVLQCGPSAARCIGSRLLYVYSVTAVDQRTVQFQLGTPYENLPLLLDIPIVAAVSVNDVQPMGTGPYYAAAQDGETVLLRNPHWWQEYKAAVTVESITLVETDSPAAIRDDFRVRRHRRCLYRPQLFGLCRLSLRLRALELLHAHSGFYRL